MIRRLFAVAAVLALAGFANAADEKKGTAVEFSGLKGMAPAEWKSEEVSNKLRHAQFKLPKEKGEAEDAELVIFISPGGGGVDANLERQVKTFKLPEGVKKEDAIKTDDTKVGEFKAKYQDIKGNYQFKAAPFDPNGKVTEKEKYRQLYVIFEDDDKKTISIRLIGGEKTIEAHKKGFEEFVKSFKK